MVADWGRQMKESVVLRCIGCGLDGKGNKITLQRRLFNHFHPASVDANPISQINEGVSSAVVMDATEDITLVLAELRAHSSEVRAIKNKQIQQETVLQTMLQVAPSPSDAIVNYPTLNCI